MREISFFKFWLKDGSPIKRVKIGIGEYRNNRWDGKGYDMLSASDKVLVVDSTANFVKMIDVGAYDALVAQWSIDRFLILISDQRGVIRVFKAGG
ncbi:MAG: hypothetical protein J7497_16525, partial [Chitinophagaceae bacterium]|nr:hypothetical protein [Chitinophagaceae bacterium]